MAKTQERRKGKLPYGFYAEVARRAGVSATMVRMVDHNKATSARVSAEIIAYRRELAADLLAGIRVAQSA